METKFKQADFIVYQGDPERYPILQVVEIVDGFYLLEGATVRFLRPVATIDATFQELWP